MRRRLLAWMTATLWIAVVVGTGCDRPCDAYCDEVTAAIEELGCLSEWGVSWEDQSYADADDYLEHCQTHFEVRVQDAEAVSMEDADAIRGECSDLLREVGGAEDCAAISIAAY